MRLFITLLLLPVTAFAAISDQILRTQTASLKGYWKCDDAAGSTTLADSSGNSKPLTTTGTSGTNYWLGEPGLVGTCFRTDGTAGYASRTDSVLGTTMDSLNFTIFMLVKGGTDYGSTSAIGVSSSAGTNNRGSMGATVGASTATGQVRGNSTTQASVTGGTGFDGNWHPIAFRRNGTTNVLDIFVDGVNAGTATTAVTTGSVNVNRTHIGHSIQSGASTFAKGSHQHVAMWNTTLSDAEILAISNSAFQSSNFLLFFGIVPMMKRIFGVKNQ